MTLLTLVHKIDIALLLVTRSAVEFCVEWFSWSQRWIERVLIGGYVFSATAAGVTSRSSTWLYVLVELVTFGLVWSHVEPDRGRTIRLWSGQGAIGRILMVGFLLLALFPRLLVPFRFLYVLRTANEFCYAATVLTTALPTSGTPGRRRRAARTKLAGLFSPLPEPAMEGAA